jgi:ribosomal-protein-alanine N-acetyltransferase
MQFTALPESDHDLVTLRPLAAADIPVWYAYLSQPAVQEHTSWDLRGPDDLDHYAQDLSLRKPSSLLRLAIAERAGNWLVGTMGFHTVSPENRTAELTYDLAPEVWGRGIATRLGQCLVAWAHAHVGLLRVQATVLNTNARSALVLQRCGFEREGLLRSYRLVRGRPGDFWMYAHVPAGT